MPKIAEGQRVGYLDAGAPWAAEAGADTTSNRYHAGLAARVKLVYDETSAKLTHSEEWEAVFVPLQQPFDADTALLVDYDDRDFRPAAPDGIRYVLPDAKIDTATYFKSAEIAIKERLYRDQKLTVFKNPKLKLYSRVGESEEEFLQRCDAAAEDQADAEAAKLRDKFEARIDRTRESILTAERRVSELEVDLQGQRQKQMVDGASAVIGILFGRRSTRSVTGTAAARRAAASKQERLRTAQGKAQSKLDELDELERDMILELEEINDRWEDIGRDIEPVEVGLEKNDIHVDEISLVWIPMGSEL
jgi:hypothetical protein